MRLRRMSHVSNARHGAPAVVAGGRVLRATLVACRLVAVVAVGGKLFFGALEGKPLGGEESGVGKLDEPGDDVGEDEVAVAQGWPLSGVTSRVASSARSAACCSISCRLRSMR